MTIKQKRLAKLVGISSTMKEAMIKAGYSPNTAVAPTKVTESKAWPELMEKYLPDDKLLTKHEEALEATKWNDFTGEREEDHAIRLKGVELGYKLKRRLGVETLQQFNIGDLKIEVMNYGKDNTNSI